MPREIALTKVIKGGWSYEPSIGGMPERITMPVTITDVEGEVQLARTATFWRTPPPADADGLTLIDREEGHFLMGPAMEKALDAIGAAADRRLTRFVSPVEAPPELNKLDAPPKRKTRKTSTQASTDDSGSESHTNGDEDA